MEFDRHGTMNPELSVVIPVLNEQAWLPALLTDLAAQQKVKLEVILADGGSTDGTLDRCRCFDAIIVNAPRGRARQLNAGFRRSTGGNLLFLHADSRLKEDHLLHNALRQWHAALAGAQRDSVAGHFPLKFMRTRPGHALAFRYMEGKTHFNRINTTNGDQGFLLKRTFFERLGGFDESQHFLEDQRLAEKIRARGTWITLPGVLHTSGRRFEEEGYHRLYILMSMLMALYSTGRMEFFSRVEWIYASHSSTGRLLLKAYFAASIKMFIHDLGFSGSIRAWLRIGRYIRQNSWQLFYFLDVLFGSTSDEGRYPLLDFHDRIFRPITDNPICDAITALISCVWFMLVLAPYFFIVDTLWPRKSMSDK